MQPSGGFAQWQGVGAVVPGALTAQEAISAAKLDWTVDPTEIVVNGKVSDNFMAMVRSDTKRILAVRTKAYVPAQNIQTFNFMDDLVESNEAKYVAAGSFGGGRRVWLMVEVAKCEIRIKGTDDISKPYLLLSNGHDGGQAVHVLENSIRISCWNSFVRATRGAGAFSIRHTQSIDGKEEQARQALQISLKHFNEYNDQINALAQVQVSPEQLGMFFRRVFPDHGDGDSRYMQTVRDRAEILFTTGRGNDTPGVRGSWWAAVNGVTEFVDHGRTRSKGGASPVSSILFGAGAEIKARAFDLALVGAGLKNE